MIGFDSGESLQVAASLSSLQGDTETAKAQMALATSQQTMGPASPEQEAAVKDAQGFLKKRDEMAGSFTVDNSGKGPKNGNVVSAVEMSKMARAMVNIEGGNSDLDIRSDTEGHSWNDPESYAAAQTAIQAERARKSAEVQQMMQTGAGRELIYKLSNNVNARSGEHKKTTIDDSHTDRAGATYDSASEVPTQASGHGVGYGANATAQFSAGNDRQMFAALTESLHRTNGSAQEGNIDSRSDSSAQGYDINEKDPTGWQAVHHDSDATKEKYAGMSREQAAVEGVAGYGSTINGEKITLNQYDKEKAANAKRSAAARRVKWGI